MKDVLLIPDSRSRQAQAMRNRYLEQSIKHLMTLQRKSMRKDTEDLDALAVTVTRLAASIAQSVRLHHQIWHEAEVPEDVIATIMRLADMDEGPAREQETA